MALLSSYPREICGSAAPTRLPYRAQCPDPTLFRNAHWRQQSGLIGTHRVAVDGGHLLVWDDKAGTYLDPATGEILPTWDDALDSNGDQDQPLHVAR
jgi:hypothetical protein